MAFEMRDLGPPLTAERVAAVERKLSIVLPEDYRAFLIEFNGGRPEPDSFPVRGWKNNPSGGIHYFFRLDGGIQSSNIDWNFKVFKGRIPQELLPIAGDGSGNLICLSLRGPNKGYVYLWDHDAEHYPPTYSNVHLVAESFEKFLNSIFYEDISAQVAEALGKKH